MISIPSDCRRLSTEELEFVECEHTYQSAELQADASEARPVYCTRPSISRSRGLSGSDEKKVDVYRVDELAVA